MVVCNHIFNSQTNYNQFILYFKQYISYFKQILEFHAKPYHIEFKDYISFKIHLHLI